LHPANPKKGKAGRYRPIERKRIRPKWLTVALLLLFKVQRATAKSRTVLLQLKFFATGLTRDRVVVIAGFLTNQKDGFRFLLTLGHVGLIAVGMNFFPMVLDLPSRAANYARKLAHLASLVEKKRRLTPEW